MRCDKDYIVFQAVYEKIRKLLPPAYRAPSQLIQPVGPVIRIADRERVGHSEATFRKIHTGVRRRSSQRRSRPTFPSRRRLKVQQSAGHRAAYERKIWEQIWEQNSVKQAQISATGRTGWDS